MSEWPAYGRDAGGSRFSPLDEINRENVTSLEVAWTYRTGDMIEEAWQADDGEVSSAFQCTPIVVDGVMYLCTPFNRVIALEPETGKEIWSFDPEVDTTHHYANQLVCRGVAAWVRGGESRIFTGTNDGRLICLDAATGKPCSDFAERGQLDLKMALDVARPSDFQVTSPPLVIGDIVVVGSAINDNQRAAETRGVVRAFDIHSGAPQWSWDPIPESPDDPAWKTWENGSAKRTGAANAWSILSADPERDLVFIPTSSPSPDFYGGERLGDNRYSDSVVALRASTGDVVWHFQTVHHDVWDYDVPAQPTLIEVVRDGQRVPAVAQATKMGHLFLLNRESGEPLFPVDERPVPKSNIPGERLSPTQPFPLAPKPLVPQSLSPDDAWGLTPLDRSECRERMEQHRYGDIFTPPSFEGTIIFPGNAGGTNWGSVAFDPGGQLVLVNTSRVAHVVYLIPQERFREARRRNPGKEISPQRGTPFAMRRETLLSPLGVPCNPPPWGTLAAVDMNTGEVRWEVTLGTTRDLAPVPVAMDWGTPNMGGPMVTGGGLVFIGAAMDNYLRAFDVDTGEELWKARLPAGGQATPMTYRVRDDGKQYVVIAAGGHGRMGTTIGDYVIAYGLPGISD